jgi:hypothetical protein
LSYRALSGGMRGRIIAPMTPGRIDIPKVNGRTGKGGHGRKKK